MNLILTKPLCASSSNLADMLTMVNPIDLGGHSSKVKVTIVIIDKGGVRGDATLCVVIFILASLLVFSMLGCRHSLLLHCNILRFSQVECTFSNILSCVHLPVGGPYLMLLALTFRYRFVLIYNKKIKYLKFPLMNPTRNVFLHMLILHSC